MDEAFFCPIGEGVHVEAKQVIQSQYLAALAMLKQSIAKCPPEIWDDPQDKFKFWSKSYHAVYFAHLYLQRSEQDFVEWEKHHDPDTGVPFTRDEVLEYLEYVGGGWRSGFPQPTWRQGRAFVGTPSTNWKCNSSISDTSSSTQASCSNVWDRAKISNWTGWVSVTISRSRNDQTRITQSL